jgi:hypothetical protein
MTPPLSFRTDPVQLKQRDANTIAQDAGLGTGRWKALGWSLPCFKGVADIIEVANDDDIPAGKIYVLRHANGVERVEYRTGYVEALAQRLGLTLNRDTADEYVRFYMGLTRGQAGRVIPVEQVDQLPLREELTLITRRKLQSAIVPLTVQDAHTVTGCFLIGDKLFSARATITSEGAVSLEPLAILADTLPVLQAVFEG